MDTNPATEVAASPEDQLTAIFEKQYGESEPEAVEESQEVEAEASEEAESEEVEETNSEETEETEDTTEGFEEIELEGEKFQVPAKLKDAFLRQQDYTKKTQEVAEQRRQVEAERAFIQQRAQLQGAAFEKAVEVQGLAKQLDQYAQIDWAQLAEQDPAQALKLNIARQQLQEQHMKASYEMQHLQAQEHQALTAKQQEMLAKGQEELAREIKGWGPDVARKLVDTGKSYGFAEQELSGITDPRHIKVLHDAHQWRELQKSKAQITKKVATAKPMKAIAGRTAQTNQQAAHIQDAKARLKKTGKAADAEAYLERLFSKRK